MDAKERNPPSFRWYRNHPQPFEYCPRADFFDIADLVIQERRTLLTHDRLYVLWQAVLNVTGVSGAAAEVGSYRGGSAFFIASAFVKATGGEVPIHVFDTFEGHPERSVTEHDPFQTVGHFKTSYKKVRAYLAPFQRVQVHAGDVLALLPVLEETTYRLVHIDTDLHQPTLACLQYFGARLAKGGVIVVDDYGSGKCPGVYRAVSEYLAQTGGFQVWDMRTEQLALLNR